VEVRLLEASPLTGGMIFGMIGAAPGTPRDGAANGAPEGARGGARDVERGGRR
jgi:hypothetical protein